MPFTLVDGVCTPPTWVTASATALTSGTPLVTTQDLNGYGATVCAYYVYMAYTAGAATTVSAPFVVLTNFSHVLTYSLFLFIAGFSALFY